jgi:L-alanine-DL-glutamate epimerase-like enolase superfamily enzyme
MATIQLKAIPYELQLIHPFTIATFTRTTTPIVLIELHYEGTIGYGEASMPPYLGETQQSALQFFSKVDVAQFKFPLDFEAIHNYIDSIEPRNTAAKAALDIALYDLHGKLNKIPCRQIFEANPLLMPATSMTIGIDSIAVIKQKVLEAADFKMLKIKLGHDNDKELIESIRAITDTPICVDVNQGWKDKIYALDMAYWLADKNVKFIEQPLPKNKLDETAWLSAKSPLPIIADEAVQRFSDINLMKDAYSGINIKLMKCTGLFEAAKMIQEARNKNLKVLIGCMNESSVANMAAAQLAPLADWVDLDGPFMIRNNPFETPVLKNGKIQLTEAPGIGVVKKNTFNSHP